MMKRRKDPAGAGSECAVFVLDGTYLYTDNDFAITGGRAFVCTDCADGRYIIMSGGATAAPLGYFYYATKTDAESLMAASSGTADLRSLAVSGTHWSISCPCDGTGPDSHTVQRIGNIPVRFLPEKGASCVFISGNQKGPETKGMLKKCIFRTAVAALLAGYTAGAVYFCSHLAPGTFINGTDVSFMDARSAYEEVQDACRSAGLSVSFRSGGRNAFRGEDISLSSSDAGQAIGSLIDGQRESCWKWPLFFSGENRRNVSGRYSFDGHRLLELVHSMDGADPEDAVPPEDAFIDRDPGGAGFVIVPEKEGDAVRTAPAVLEIARRIRLGLFDMDLSRTPGIYAVPSVRSNSPELSGRLSELNTAVSGTVTYLLPDGDTMVLDGTEMTEWVSVSDDGEYYLDEDDWYDNAAVFVDSLAASCNSVWKEREFDSTWNGTVTVRGGTYGYIVDKDSETEAVCSLMYDPVEEEREPYYSQEESSDRSNHGFGGTYAEVSIADQHLWYYEDGELVLDSPVVTGTRGSHDTPKGQFFVQFTQRNAVLVGRPDSNGNPSYRTPVSYWMPFYDGCGMHDADWRSSFGGGIYTYGGSHGCVNMPHWAAGDLFEHIENGTPVIIF